MPPRTATRCCLVASLALLCIGAAHATTDKRFAAGTAPGSYIWVGNHRLHLHCIGSGSPTVVFDAGLGGTSLDWVLVHPKVSRFTRACTYDRAGYGWSDAGPGPRDSARISRELAMLLGNGSVAGPYVLVGHSFGGFNVRLFSHNHPQRVAGMVLIDASHEDQFARFDDAGVGSMAPRGSTFFIRNAFAAPAAMPVQIARLAESFAATRSSFTTFKSELGHLRSSAKQLAAAPALPQVPVTVISRRANAHAMSDKAGQREIIWMDMQTDLVRRARYGQHVIANTNDHYIHLREPQLVVDAIRAVVRQSR